MFVFDSSAFINGSRYHFFPDIMRPVWVLVENAIDDGRVIVPRQVFVELKVQDDEMTELLRRHKAAIAEPSEHVQRRAGVLENEFPKPGIRNGADPFILAEAEAREFTVVTYEGTTLSGERARRWEKSMPAICNRFDIPCCTLPEALRVLGLNLDVGLAGDPFA